MGISEDSAEDDLKRQTIGIGETITISLEAKPTLMGDPKKLEWIVTNEEGALILPEKMKGITSFDAQAKPTAEKKRTGYGDSKNRRGVSIQTVFS